jgi:hypothetical protein
MRQRIQRAYAAKLAHQFRLSLLDSRSSVVQEARAIVCGFGGELEQVVKVRPDTRGVFVVQHPEWGRCILKTVLDTHHGSRALANVSIARAIKDSASTIFPSVYSVETSFTLEQFVEGSSFAEWLVADPDLGVVAEYFDGLRSFGEGAASQSGSRCFRPSQVRGLSELQIRKCLRHMRYYSGTRQTVRGIRLTMSSAYISSRIRWLSAASEVVSLPRGLMCGDMGHDNIMVQRAPTSMYNIDVERLSPGHWGFDAAYFISSLFAQGLPLDTVRAVQDVVLTPDRLGGHDSATFFKVLTETLAEISEAVHGARQSRTSRLPIPLAATARPGRAEPGGRNLVESPSRSVHKLASRE